MRRYTVTVCNGNRTVSPVIRVFPLACPNCGQRWQIRTGYMYNGKVDTGGRAARCSNCGYKRFEVIDKWVGSFSR